MIPRYTRPEMAAIWHDDARLANWLKVELAVMSAQEADGTVPQGTHERIAGQAKLDAQRMSEIEDEVHHDIIAFLTMVGESLDENDRRYLHLGMTSSDLIDTAFALQIQQAGQLVLEALDDCRGALWERANEHRHTPMIGRSHGIHGEPITFGLKLLTFVDELDRAKERLLVALESCREGQISGAMGTYAHNPPAIEAAVCERLGLRAAKTSTQVIARDNHAQVLWALASLGASLERLSVELRHLQRTEVLEVEEAFAKGQKGSSAMPHKRNPISGENLTGLARLLRGAVIPALENVALWHERDISHSSVERVSFPDSFILAHYMLVRMTRVIKNLNVFPDNMARNMQLYGGVVFSQKVLLALVNAGKTREDAYKLVQTCAHNAWNKDGGNFRANVEADEAINHVLTAEQLADCFDPASFLTHVDAVFARFDGE
jgi:adenylosuccinate lyase